MEETNPQPIPNVQTQVVMWLNYLQASKEVPQIPREQFLVNVTAFKLLLDKASNPSPTQISERKVQMSPLPAVRSQAAATKRLTKSQRDVSLMLAQMESMHRDKQQGIQRHAHLLFQLHRLREFRRLRFKQMLGFTVVAPQSQRLLPYLPVALSQQESNLLLPFHVQASPSSTLLQPPSPLLDPST